MAADLFILVCRQGIASDRLAFKACLEEDLRMILSVKEICSHPTRTPRSLMRKRREDPICVFKILFLVKKVLFKRGEIRQLNRQKESEGKIFEKI